jgi:hypothetical protein
MHDAHLLASGVGYAFDRDGNGERTIGVEMLGLGRQQIPDEWVHAFNSVLGTMVGRLHDENLAVVTVMEGYCAEINAAILRLCRWRCDDSTRAKTLTG